MRSLFIIFFVMFYGSDAFCQVQCSKSTSTNNKLHDKPNILFLFADDWGWPSASFYGDTVINLPTIDRIAQEGFVFNNAFCASPSCSPSRASVLTGMYPHQLATGSQLWGLLSIQFPNYTRILSEAGYEVGLQGKGYGPSGNERSVGYNHNPAGKSYRDFNEFLETTDNDKPFCFWFGSLKPHRPYTKGIGATLKENADKVMMPPFLPDSKDVREDILDYYHEVEQFDSVCGTIIEKLAEKNLIDNTLIVISGDNGYPFPRAKANIYDAGSHVPLIIYWKGKVAAGKNTNTLINLMDLAPTFLEAAGESIPTSMTGKSLIPLLTQKVSEDNRGSVYLERERHAYAQFENVGYPVRAIRTEDFLYVRNFAPERFPAGEPQIMPGTENWFLGDCDASPSKDYIVANLGLKVSASWGDKTFYELAFGKRPAEELYAVRNDPFEMINLAADSTYLDVLKAFRIELDNWMSDTKDPRYHDFNTKIFDTYPYFGPEYIKADF